MGCLRRSLRMPTTAADLSAIRASNIWESVTNRKLWDRHNHSLSHSSTLGNLTVIFSPSSCMPLNDGRMLEYLERSQGSTGQLPKFYIHVSLKYRTFDLHIYKQAPYINIDFIYRHFWGTFKFCYLIHFFTSSLSFVLGAFLVWGQRSKVGNTEVINASRSPLLSSGRWVQHWQQQHDHWAEAPGLNLLSCRVLWAVSAPSASVCYWHR